MYLFWELKNILHTFLELGTHIVAEVAIFDEIQILVICLFH